MLLRIQSLSFIIIATRVILTNQVPVFLTHFARRCRFLWFAWILPCFVFLVLAQPLGIPVSHCLDVLPA